MDLVMSSFPAYLRLLQIVFLPLIGIALLLHGADLILVIANGVFGFLPDGFRILIQVCLVLTSMTLSVCFPYFCVHLFLSQKSGQDLSLSSQLSNFSLQEFWRILVIVSMTHIVGLVPLFVPALILWLHYIHEIFLWISLALFVIYMPIWILILWFLSFSLHHYVFLQEISWKPLKASYRLVKNRFWSVLGISVVWMVISLGLSAGFGLLSFMETGLRFLSSAPSEGWLESFQGMSQVMQSGKLDGSVLKELGQKFSFLQAPSLVGLIESILMMVLSGSLFSFFFLYLLGHYHNEKWKYPRDLFE